MPNFQDFQLLAHDCARQTARKLLKVSGVERYNQKLHFDYLICGDLKLW